MPATKTAAKATKKRTPRKVAAKKSTTAKAAAANRMRNLAANARAPKPCDYCTAEIGSNNMARHIESKHPEYAHLLPKRTSKPAQQPLPLIVGPPGTLPEGVTPRSARLAVAGYINALSDNVGKRKKNGVSLGALPGFPSWSNDPEVIGRAIETLRARILEERGLKRADLVERILILESFDATSANGSQRELALACLKWVSENRPGKPAWSDKALHLLGFSVADLKEAGIVQ